MTEQATFLAIFVFAYAMLVPLVLFGIEKLDKQMDETERIKLAHIEKLVLRGKLRNLRRRLKRKKRPRKPRVDTRHVEKVRV